MMGELGHDPDDFDPVVDDAPTTPPRRVSKPAPRSLIPKLRAHSFYAARLELRHDPQTLRWTVVLCSRTTKEDVVIAWKQTEADAAAWARNYGVLG